MFVMKQYCGECWIDPSRTKNGQTHMDISQRYCKDSLVKLSKVTETLSILPLVCGVSACVSVLYSLIQAQSM